MLRCLEKAINIYYRNNTLYLIIALLLMTGVIVVKWNRIKKTQQLAKTVKEDAVLQVIYLLMVAGVGAALYCMGISTPMVYDYFHVLFFVSSMLLVAFWALSRIILLGIKTVPFCRQKSMVIT